MAYAKEISVDAALVAELEGILTLKKEHKLALEAILSGLQCFTILRTGFGKSSIKHRGAYRHGALTHD